MRAAEEEDAGHNEMLLRELVTLTSRMIDAKKANSSRAGELGTKSRLQPRYQKGKSTEYDRVCNERIKSEASTLADVKRNHQLLHECAEAEQAERLRQLGISQEHLATPTSIATLMGGGDGIGSISQQHLTAPAPTATLVGGGDAIGKDNNQQVIVIVPGAKNFRVGFAGADAPHSIFPSQVGRARHAGIMVGLGQKDSYVGDEAQSKRGILTIKYPIERGMFVNWDDAHKLFHHAMYNELCIAPEDCAIIMTDTPCTLRAERERLCEELFASFNVRHVHITTRNLLALYASGRTTGVSVHIGDSGICVLPVLDGQGLAYALQASEVGGRDVTDHLQAILTERGYSFVRSDLGRASRACHGPFTSRGLPCCPPLCLWLAPAHCGIAACLCRQTTTSERGLVNDIKESLAFVAVNPDIALTTPTSSFDRTYELPDGQCITIGNERWRCAEVLFAPALRGAQSQGLADVVFGAVQRCPIGVRAAMWNNIVLSGGGSCLAGLADRLHADLKRLAPTSLDVRVIAPPERAQSAWIGGSVLASLPNFETTMGVSRAEYDVSGPSAVHRKCCEGGYLCYVVPPPKASKQSTPPSLAQLSPSAPSAPAMVVSISPSAPPPPPQPPPTPTVVKSDEVAIWQPQADTNSVLLQVGQLVKDGAATVTAGTLSVCTELPPLSSTLGGAQTLWPSVQHYMISEAASATDKLELPTVPMVVFCVDCSGSMGMRCKPSANAGSSVTRLECMQQALVEQISTLEKQQPDCIVALVAFSNHVDVLTDSGSTVTVEAHQLRTLTAALNTGIELRSHVRQPVSHAARMLREHALRLRSLGATALGPALATAIGLASVPGSRVLVLTDGLANTGIGAIHQGRAEPFYFDVASSAADTGVTVSVLTLEGEECSMENLGTTADVTGGNVEVVHPSEMGRKVACLMQHQVLANGVKCTLALPEGVHARTEADATLQDANGAHANSGQTSVLNLSCASVTEETELTVRFRCDGPPALQSSAMETATYVIPPISMEADTWEMVGGEGAGPMPATPRWSSGKQSQLQPPCSPIETPSHADGRLFQMRLEYTLTTGERMLTIITQTIKVTEERAQAETNLNGTVSALAAIHHAAELAQSGAYLNARAALISTQRMLQRAMRTSSVANQKAYLSFIVQAEKLDGFMRERQAAEQVFGACNSKARQVQRDDEAAKAMYQMKSITSRALHAH